LWLVGFSAVGVFSLMASQSDLDELEEGQEEEEEEQQQEKKRAPNIDWVKIIREYIRPALRWYEQQGIEVRLRTIHYRLCSPPYEVIPNTASAYNSLSHFTAIARRPLGFLIEERKKQGKKPSKQELAVAGTLLIDCFVDKVRYRLNESKEYETPQQYIDRGIKYLKSAPTWYSIPRWYKQPIHVEAWIEKDALASTFDAFLKDRQVPIAVNRGYSSLAFLEKNWKQVEYTLKYHGKKKFVALTYGDLDPSGDDMDSGAKKRWLQYQIREELYDDAVFEDLDKYGNSWLAKRTETIIDKKGRKRKRQVVFFEFRRMAVTEEQIAEYNLPSKPKDKNTLAKLGRDTRTKGFKKKMGGKLIAVELDALLGNEEAALRLKQSLLEAVDEFFDQSIYDELLAQEERQPEYIKWLVNNQVEFKDEDEHDDSQYFP
jgi:hypothetical protein